MTAILIAMVCAPSLLAAALGLYWLCVDVPSERAVARLTALVSTGVCVAAVWLGGALHGTRLDSLETVATTWLRVGRYHLDLGLLVDRLSWPIVLLTALLVALIGVFSERYVHRDRGYFRFFVLLNLFSGGALLALTAASFDLLMVGWELVGITSVLLVGFFDERADPVRNAARVFAYYRVAGLGLVVGLYVLHANAHSTRISELIRGAWPVQTSALDGRAAALAGFCFLVAAAGKSAQLPFSGWLPRAMEGPTPSSAIFYGAISVHLGAYLLLRIGPWLHDTPGLSLAVMVVGAATALLATLVHRTASDAKTSLAWAGMAQLGIIFVEVGAGWPRLALAHVVGHAVVRTLQFLRAPSMLHDYHRVHAAAGGHLTATGTHYERILPRTAQAWLYRAGIERAYYDALVDRLVVAPITRFARWGESLEGDDGRASRSVATEPTSPPAAIERVYR